MMNPISTYNKILEYRNILKSLQQLSWEVSQLERRFPLDNIKDKDLPKLVETYEAAIQRGVRLLKTLDEATTGNEK